MPLMRDPLADLNEQQQKAVTALTGPVLVLAGAGSGKTRVLTHRLAHLIATKTAKPSQLLAVTFTNKAAHEMRTRVSNLVGEHAAGQMSLGTFHSLGVRLLREQHMHAPRSASFTIVDTSDSERLIREACQSLSISTQQISPRNIRSIISRAKAAHSTPETLAASAQSPAEEAAARVYPLYEQLLAEHDSYDFDDLIIKPLQLLSAHDSVRARYQQRWQFLSVDEYQDTNPPQDALLKLLLGPGQNLCAVGDDYQAIYSWRGAQVDHILQFESQFPNCTTVYLTQNYRSTSPILEAANQLIAANQEQKHKELWTETTSGSAVELLAVQSDRAEASTVRSGIQETIKNGTPANQCAILYRTNAQSRAFEEELMLHNIPYQIVGGIRFYDRAEIKDAMALLQLAVNPSAALSLERITKALITGVGPKTLSRIRAHAAKTKSTLVQGIQDDSVLTARLQAHYAPLAAALSQAQATMDSTSPDAVLSELLKRSGYLAYLKHLDRSDERLENIDELLNVAATYTSAQRLIEDVALLSDIDEAAGNSNRVLCMTFHAAKGLEFDCVWVAGCEEGLLPHRNSIDSPAEIEEERRLLYVGMTRARKGLTISHAQSRTIHGESLPQAPSRFLEDLPESVNEVAMNTDQPLGDQDTVAGGLWDAEGREVGEIVSHPHFGQGVIIQISGSLITCVFEGHGMKTIDASISV